MKKTISIFLLVTAVLLAFVACDSSVKVSGPKMIAAIGDVQYETLQEAVDNATTSETTIKLLCDAEGEGATVTKTNLAKGIVTYKLSFDFDGHTYTLKSAEKGAKEANPEITDVKPGFRFGSAMIVTISNGTIKADADFTEPLITSYGQLTVTSDTSITPAEGECALNIVNGSATIETTDISGQISLKNDVTIKFSEEPTQVAFVGDLNPEKIFFGDTTATDLKEAVAMIGNVGYDSLEAAVTSATDGQTIVLVNKVDITSPVGIEKDVTINLNEKTVTGKGSRVFHVKSGELTLIGKGTVKSEQDGSKLASNSSVIRVGNSDNTAAKLTVDKDITISTSVCYGISVFNGSGNNPASENVELILRGTVSVTGEASAISGTGNSFNGPTYITIEETAKVECFNDNAIYFPCEGLLTINGTVSGKGGIEMKSGSATIIGEQAKVEALATTTTNNKNNDGCSTSGYAIAVVENSGYKGQPKININGGSIIGSISIVADNAVAADKKGSIVIKGGSFTDLASAVKYAAEDATIKLYGDLTLTERIDLQASNSCTLDLDGHTINSTNSCANGSVFNVLSGTDITIKNGKLVGIAGPTGLPAPYTNECDVITARGGSVVTVEGLDISVDSATGSCCYAFNGAKIYIKSGTFENKTTQCDNTNTDVIAMLLNQGDVPNQCIFVSGGTFKGYSPANGDNSKKVTSFLAEGYEVTGSDRNWTVVKAN